MKKEDNELICPGCGEINDGNLDFCEYCGEDLRPGKVRKDEAPETGTAIIRIILFLLILIFFLIRK